MGKGMDRRLADGAAGEADRAVGLLQLQETCGQGLDGGPAAPRGQAGLVHRHIPGSVLRLEELGIAGAVGDMIHKKVSFVAHVFWGHSIPNNGNNQAPHRKRPPPKERPQNIRSTVILRRCEQRREDRHTSVRAGSR